MRSPLPPIQEEGILNSRSPDNPLVSVTALHTLAGIPSQSFRALFVPALLLAVLGELESDVRLAFSWSAEVFLMFPPCPMSLGCSTELARRASSLLLHVALSPSVVAPDTLLVALEGLADTLVNINISFLFSGDCTQSMNLHMRRLLS